GLLVLLLEVRLREPVHGLVFAVEVRRRPPGRLVQSEAVVVFVQDVECVRERHGPHHNGSGWRAKLLTRSRQAAAPRTLSSWPCTPTSCALSGSPSSVHPNGTETVGLPRKL